MKTVLHIALFVFGLQLFAVGQNSKFDLDKGNSAYENQDFEGAETQFRKLTSDKDYKTEARFNLGNTLIRLEKPEDAINEYKQIINGNVDSETKAKAFHNLGNAYMQSQKLEDAVEAYKNSLRLNPKDNDTRYNLAVAQKLLNQKQQQQQQQQQQQNQDQNQDKNQDKQDQDKQNQDQQKQDKENQNQQKQDEKGDQEKDENQDQKNDPKDNKDEEQKGEPREVPMKISKEDAERLLEMMQDEEKAVQEKVKKKKSKNKTGKIEKDW